MKWDKVSKILSQNRKIPYLKIAEETYKLTKQIQENWEKIFGKLSTQVTFSHLYNGILVIETENPMWATEITFYKNDLIKKTNALLKKAKIYDIRIHLAGKKVEKKQLKTIEKTDNLEEKIKEANKQKSENNFKKCPTCHTWWEDGKPCIFCPTSP